MTSTSPPSCSNVNSAGGQQHQILPDPPKIYRSTSTLHFSGNSATGLGSLSSSSYGGSGVKSPIQDISSPLGQNESSSGSVLGYCRSIRNQMFQKTGDMKSAVQKVLEAQGRNSTGQRSNRRPVSMIEQSNSELTLNSENVRPNSGQRNFFAASQSRVPSETVAPHLLAEEDNHNVNNINKFNNNSNNIINDNNNEPETQIVRPIAKRPNSGNAPLTHSHSASEIVNKNVQLDANPTNTLSNVKTTEELLQGTKSSDTDPAIPVVRLRNPPSSRSHFRTRPQSLIESSSPGNIPSVHRPNSVTSSYTKSPSIKPLKGSPLEDGGVPQSYTPVNRVASNAKLLKNIQRQKLQSNPEQKTMSLEELQQSHKLCSRRVSTESMNSNVSNSTICTKKVIYDAVSKQFYSPAEAYTQGLIDVNTFNRSRRDKTRLLFPKSRSVTSINSNESVTNEITGSNKIRKMCIHDRKSNEVLNLDEAFSRGIIDETRYNTLRNQEMDQSFSMGTKSASFNSLQFSSQQSNTLPLPRSGPAKVRPSSMLGDPTCSSSQNLASSSTLNPGTPTRKPLFRKISSPSSTLPREDTVHAKLPSPFRSFVKHSRSQSANSLISTASAASSDSHTGKLFIKNPNSNALVDLKTAKYQEIIDDKTYDLKEREEKGVNRSETLVIPSNIYVSVKTSQGKQKLELPEALKEGFISQDDYEEIEKTLSENGYAIKIDNLDVK